MKLEGVNVRKLWGRYLFIKDDVVIYNTQISGYALDCFVSCAYESKREYVEKRHTEA